MKVLYLLLGFTFVASTNAYVPRYSIQSRDLSLKTPISSKLTEIVNKAPLPTLTARMALPSDDQASESSPRSNAIFGLAWLSLLAFTAFIAPGSFGSAIDNEMIAKIIENPLQPDINQLFYFVFNLFVIIPVCLAAVILPQASNEGAPPTPFLIGSAFLGYFALGPYLILKGPSKDVVVLDELNWVTQNIFENKAFNWFQVALFFYFMVTYAIEPAFAESASVVTGFKELTTSSKFACVSSADLTLLTITAAAVIPQDYKLRNPNNESRALLIGASTLLLPVLGSALYCALRPNLPQQKC